MGEGVGGGRCKIFEKKLKFGKKFVDKGKDVVYISDDVVVWLHGNGVALAVGWGEKLK